MKSILTIATVIGLIYLLIVVTAARDTIVPQLLAEPLLRQHSGPIMQKTQAAAGHNSFHFNPGQSPWPEVDSFLASADDAS